MSQKIKVKITLDADACIACSVCFALNNQAFIYDNTTSKYKVTPKYQEIEVTPQELEQLQQVAEACPVQAIKIIVVKNNK